MAIKNILNFERNLKYFAEKTVPQDFIQRQINCAIYLQGELVDLSWGTIDPGTEFTTQHSIRNWQISVDNEAQRELGTSLHSWQTKDKESDAIPLSKQETRLSLTGRYNTGYRAASKSIIRVFNKATRVSPSGTKFLYVQEIEDGNSKVVPRNFIKLATANTREYMRLQALNRSK